ncbi:MAG: GNAT family N-acetyltransferase [Chloroflexota bacterium]|nr:MAG: GNAT family N-acetyltransferase [Chloroflexota bacterium]
MEEIKEIKNEHGLRNSMAVIRDSFKTVAVEFQLTQDNCPTHPSFMTLDRLLELEKKARFFGLFLNNMQIGFVAIEKADDSLYYMEQLAVLPEYRHTGYGEKLVEFVLDYVKSNKGEKVSLGMIDESAVLKNWYQQLGFKETGTRNFEHLPFTVCFMEKSLLPTSQ